MNAIILDGCARAPHRARRAHRAGEAFIMPPLRAVGGVRAAAAPFVVNALYCNHLRVLRAKHVKRVTAAPSNGA